MTIGQHLWRWVGQPNPSMAPHTLDPILSNCPVRMQPQCYTRNKLNVLLTQQSPKRKLLCATKSYSGTYSTYHFMGEPSQSAPSAQKPAGVSEGGIGQMWQRLQQHGRTLFSQRTVSNIHMERAQARRQIWPMGQSLDSLLYLEEASVICPYTFLAAASVMES